MFKEYVSARFKTSKDKDEILDRLEEELDYLGRTSINKNGKIYISGERFEGFGFTTDIVGQVRKHHDHYKVELDINASPGILAWLIAICFFPIGALVFILPYNAKEEAAQKLNGALEDFSIFLEQDES